MRHFEADIAPSQDMGARLFYTDLERTVGLLDLLSKQYDVVLMNPPYGEGSPEAFLYCKGAETPGNYPTSYADLATCFLEQALDLVYPGALVGALVPRSFLFLTDFTTFRRQLLTSWAIPHLVHDYGLDILDGASVRTCGVVLARPDARNHTQTTTLVQQTSYHPIDSKRQVIETACVALTKGSVSPAENNFLFDVSTADRIPFWAFAYSLPRTLAALFALHPPLDVKSAKPDHNAPRTQIADVKQGLSTADDFRFIRLWWEVRRADVGRGRRWVPLAKGGHHNFFYGRLDHVVLWQDDGAELKRWAGSLYGGGHWSRLLQGHKFYFRPGITFNRRAWRLRPFALLPDGCLFSDSGQTIIPRQPEQTLPILGMLCSSLLSLLKLAIAPERKWEIRPVASLPIAQGDLTTLARLADQAVRSVTQSSAGDETCPDFEAPYLLRLLRIEVTRTSPLVLADLLARCHRERARNDGELTCLLKQIDEEVYQLYALSSEDRQFVREELARRPKSEGGYSTAELTTLNGGANSIDTLQQSEHPEGLELTFADTTGLSEDSSFTDHDLVTRLLSHYLKQVIEMHDDGIVPIGAMHGRPALIIGLRHAMERDLGEEITRALEQQAPAYLGTKDLADWIETDFFPWHVALYRNRPIFWLLSSENFEKGHTRLSFRAYLHYLKLTPDTLPRLLAYHFDPTLESTEREWSRAREEASRLEGKARSVAMKTADEWLNTLAALKACRAAIERVIQGPAHAQNVPTKAKWLDRTIAEVRGGQDVGHGYRPDIDYGVLVNIAPLVEQKLLPRAVLKRLGG